MTHAEDNTVAQSATAQINIKIYCLIKLWNCSIHLLDVLCHVYRTIRENRDDKGVAAE